MTVSKFLFTQLTNDTRFEGASVHTEALFGIISSIKVNKMKDTIQKIFKSRITAFVLLSVMILLQLFNITNVIVNEKQGYHSDEIFSFGLANNFYQPFIQTDYIYSKTDEFKNVNEWVSGDVLRNYVTVQENQRFRYDSVWYNQTNDRHPPFYYAVMHTICSFFPNEFNVWFGYAINFICFIITQIFLYLIGEKLLQSRAASLMMCLAWGFSTAAVNMTVFIRMYSMLVMWTVIWIYLHSKLSLDDHMPSKKMLAALVCITFLGALTQHMFLLIAFITAVVFCIRYLVKKKWKIFWAYGFSVLGGTLLSAAVFPATISHFLTEENEGGMNLFFKQINITFNYFTKEVLALSTNRFSLYLIILLTVLIAAVILSLPILFLFRKNEKLQTYLSDKKQRIRQIPGQIKSFSIQKVLHHIRTYHIMPLIMVLCILTLAAIVSYKMTFFDMGYIDRYLFIVFPMVMMVTAMLIKWIFSRFKYRNAASAVVLGLLALNIILHPWCDYTFIADDSIKDLKSLTKDSSCIVVEANLGECWLINTLVIDMYDVKNLFVTDYDDDKNLEKEICSIDNNEKLYVMISKDAIITADNDFNKEIDFYRNLSVSKTMEKKGTYTIFQREYHVYELNPGVSETKK